MNRAILILAVIGVTGLGYWAWPEQQQVSKPAVSAPETQQRCDDGDPCTLDRFHEHQNQCIHVPDALCTKPCQTAADCRYPEDVAPCMEATCQSGQCRYMKIGRDECIRCDDNTPCKQSFCSPRECRNGFCRENKRSCDDKNGATWDRCNAKKQACEHYLTPDTQSCQSNNDCKSDHPCQRFDCVDTRCRLTKESESCGDSRLLPRACKNNRDCIQKRGDECIAGPCEDGFCKWRKVSNSNCKACTGDHDCQEDASFCGWPICTGTVCTVETVPFCVDENPLTVDSCSNDMQACLHRYEAPPPKCKKAPESDANPDTIDVCDTESGKTVHLSAGQGACKTSNRCWYTYKGDKGHCLGHAIQCMHDDACEARCDPERGCVLDSAKDCHCTSDADCDLGSPCARVFCIDPGKNGACWGTFINDCVACKSDSDCRMDNWCVFGSCSDAGYCRYEDGVTCDDKNPNTFGFCHGQRDQPCTYEPIYNYAH